MKYNKLWQYIAENTDESISAVFTKCHISSQTLFSMKNPGKDLCGHKCGSVNLSVIDRLCTYLKCQPSDIMELDSASQTFGQEIK